MKKTIILLTFITILSMNSCLDSKHSDNKNSNESSNSIVKEDRKKKIEQTKYYMKNRTVTDENGITYDLRIERKEIGRNKMYESEKIYFDNEDFVIVSSYQIEYDFTLTANGDLIDVIPYGGYELESKRSDRNGFDIWCSENIIFFPELNSDDDKKETVSNFSDANCNLGTEINNKLKKERNLALKASGIIGEYKIP